MKVWVFACMANWRFCITDTEAELARL